MKRLMARFFPVVVSVLAISCKAQEAEMELPEELKGLSVGIEVTHEPDTAYAQVGEDGIYKWIFKTRVTAHKQAVSIVEFGAFMKTQDGWEERSFTGKPFTAEQFEKWYSCPEAKLQKGTAYADSKNWAKSYELEDATALWYYIGTVDGGTERVMGYALMYCKGEVR